MTDPAGPTLTSPASPAEMSALAKRLLVGRGGRFAPHEAIGLLNAAMARGDAEAALISANLAAAGAWRPQNWDEALDLLLLAAERGSVLAQGQLQVLTGEIDGRDWRDLRARVDIGPWLNPPTRVPICETPRIRIAEGFIAPAVCDWLMARAKNNLEPAKMLEVYGGTPHLTTERTNSNFLFDIVEADVVLVLVRARISAFIKLPTVAFEPPQILHYSVGQELKPHFDFLQRSVSDEVAAQLGNQIATVLIYLNDAYEGGETDFPRANVRHKGAKGDVMVFANVDAAGQPDRMTLHAGLAPLSGEKWVLSQWVRNRPIAAV